MTKDVEIEVTVQVVTAKALLCFDGKRAEWVPKSQISDYTSKSGELDGSVTGIFLPEWLAIEKGFV